MVALGGGGEGGVADVFDEGAVGGDGGVADGGALGPGGEEGGAPVIHAAVGEGGADGDEAGEVFVFGAEAVEDPGAHAGADLGVAAGVEFEEGAAVGGVAAVHGADDAQFIGALGDVGEEVADGEAALAVLAELPGRF